MAHPRKLGAVVGFMLMSAVILVILMVWYVFTSPINQTNILAYVTLAISGALGAAIGSYISKRNPSDERETFILYQSSTYAWFFLFITLPFVAMLLANSPPPYGIYAALLLYGVWLIAIIVFTATALYRNWR